MANRCVSAGSTLLALLTVVVAATAAHATSSTQSLDQLVARKRATLERRTQQCARGCECRPKPRDNPKWTKWEDIYFHGTFSEGNCRYKVHGALQLKWRMRNGECKPKRGK